MKNRLPLSVLIPVKNDEENLRICLEGLREVVSDVVVVDSQSEDNTAELCKKEKVTLLNFQWDGSFPKKRNWALMNHEFKNEWILLLDADERPTEAFFNEIDLILKSPKHEAYWVVFKNFFMGMQIRGDDFRKISLIKKGKVFYERLDEDRWSNLDMEVHEHPIAEGTVGMVKTMVPHHDHRGLSSYMLKHLDYAEWEANKFVSGLKAHDVLSFRQRVKYAMLDSWFLGPAFFIYLYLLRGGVFDGKVGLTFSIQKWIYFWNIKSKINNLRVVERKH